MMCRRFALAAACVLLVSPGVAAAQSDLERARMLYNAGQFDEAIEVAGSAKVKPPAAASATLIIARSRLERFRKLDAADELAAARSALVSLNPRDLSAQEAIEWQIGVATALFLENELGPAVEAFTSLLPAARGRLVDAEYDKLLEWWGAAVSRLAESLTGDARRQMYDSLRSEIRLELERNPLSRPAAYWSVVALRGAGNLDAAWNAAIAAWIRAGGEPDGHSSRADLERFVIQTLIPERAQARTAQRLDAEPTVAEIAMLTGQWRAVTGRWYRETQDLP